MSRYPVHRPCTLVILLVCAVSAVAAWLTAADLSLYLATLQQTKLANPPATGHLWATLGGLMVIGVLLLLAAWQTYRGAPQHVFACEQWSPVLFGLRALVIWYWLLANYPVPAQAHHVDKFLGGVAVCLALTSWYVWYPEGLGRLLAKPWWKGVNIALVNVLVFVLAGEAVARLADPILARHRLFGDKQTPAHLKPHVPVRGSIGVSNAQGFRDKERPLGRTAARRVVALGDSFTWGAGVSYDEAFVTRVERDLQAEFPGLEMVNLGVPGWGPYEELHLLKVYGLRFAPDVVVLNFFVGNDIQNKRGDDANLPQPIVVAGQSYYAHTNGNWVHDTIGPDRWFLYYDLAYLGAMGRAKFGLLWEGMRQGTPGGTNPDAPPVMSRAAYLRSIRERSEIYLHEDTPLFREHWTRTQRVLADMQRQLNEAGSGFVIVAIPDHIQLDPALQNEYLGATGQGRDSYDFEKPQRLIRAWARERNVPLLDLLPAFKNAGRPEERFFPNDFHFTADGNRLAAESIGPPLAVYLRERFETAKTRHGTTDS